jgi:hypothetical protein
MRHLVQPFVALGELGVQREGFHARVLFQVPHHQGVLHEKKITFRERTVSNLCSTKIRNSTFE